MGAVTPVLAINANNANRLLVPFGCDAALSVGDWVYVDNANDNKAIKSANNTDTNPVIGVCFDKSGDNNCRVLCLGLMDGFTGLVRGSKVFLNTDGTATTTRPTIGYVQTLGVAVSSNEMLVKTDLQRILNYGS